MAEQVKNSKLANQIYLLINVLNLGFFVYIFARIFNLVNVRELTRGVYLVILIAFIVLMNVLANYAKRNGGTVNPIRGIMRARIIHTVSVVILIGGILGVSLFSFNRNVLYISLLAIPLDIYAIYLAHNDTVITDETDLLDDFDLDEN